MSCRFEHTHRIKLTRCRVPEHYVSVWLARSSYSIQNKLELRMSETIYMKGLEVLPRS